MEVWLHSDWRNPRAGTPKLPHSPGGERKYPAGAASPRPFRAKIHNRPGENSILVHKTLSANFQNLHTIFINKISPKTVVCYSMSCKTHPELQPVLAGAPAPTDSGQPVRRLYIQSRLVFCPQSGTRTHRGLV